MTKKTECCKAEILAPAGSFECIEAAVRTGADAVYLGSKDFSARQGAQNFDNNELARAVEYCHERDVKVHLALNTAVFDSELSACAGLIEYAARVGVDALIVSDLGVLSLARSICPHLSLHASTQMGIGSLSGVLTAHNLGFERAVLARELSETEIEKIVRNSPIETEVFVHGALCMSVSGQCYLSAMLGKRSGNRGRCAQPCRLNFSVGKDGEYALSLKDNSLYEHVTNLCAMGVTSLKIEGRMKRPEYTAAAVSLIKAAMQGRDTKEMLSLSRDIFSRSGFTDGYFKGEIDKKMFGYRRHEDVLSADNAFSKIHEFYRRENPRVAVCAELKVLENAPVSLFFCDKCGNTVVAASKLPLKSDKPLSEQFALKQIGRLGSTPYYIDSFKCDIGENLSLSPSDLNALRRQAAEKLSEIRKTPKNREIFAPSDISCNLKMSGERKIYARYEKIEQILESYDNADVIFLPVRECLKVINKKDLFDKIKEKLVIELDRAPFSNDEFLENSLKTLKENGLLTVCIQNVGQIAIAKKFKLKMLYGPFMNVYNSRALKVLCENEVEAAVASFELPYKKIQNLMPFVKVGALVYGYLPLMITRACPVKSADGCTSCDKEACLTDRMGKKFRVLCKGNVSEILNSVPLCTDLSKHDFNDLDFVLCYFTNEDSKRCNEVVLSVKNMSPIEKDANFTRGLYKNGVI